MASVGAFAAGVEVSERDVGAAGALGQAYYAFGLFVLGGLDLGTPTGGPALARGALWVAYFVAPLITASAILETALRLLVPLARRVRPPSDHVVLAGAGRLTRLYIQELRKRDRRRGVIVVEQDRSHPALAELTDNERLQVLAGDITSDAVLDRLNLPGAHRVLLLTGDDFANLDAAAKMLRRAPGLTDKIVVHVSELAFMRQTAGSSVARDSETFNGHQFAARRLVREHLTERFQRTPYRDLVVLAGFGRFGQSVLHQLQQDVSGMFGPVVILDREASKQVRFFDEEPGFSGEYRTAVLDGDLLDPEVWHEIGERVSLDHNPPVIIMGSGDDGTNLHAALTVCQNHPEALVIVRSFRTSPFMQEVLREAGAHPFNLGELIGDGMPEDWF